MLPRVPREEDREGNDKRERPAPPSAPLEARQLIRMQLPFGIREIVKEERPTLRERLNQVSKATPNEHSDEPS